MPAEARADVTKAQCLGANTKGQDFRREGKFAEAREQLRTCAASACPPLVRDDCAQRLNELDATQPTVIFDVKDGAGKDITTFTLQVDGKELSDTMIGAALAVDPGRHTFTFDVPGHPSVSAEFVLHEGDKARREPITVGAPVSMPPPSTGELPPGRGVGEDQSASNRDGADGSSGRRIAGLVVGGVGVAGLVVGAVAGLMTLSAVSQQQTDCGSATHCPHPADAATDHSNASTDQAISVIGFAAGGALLVGGGILFLTGNHAPSPSPSTGLVLTPEVGPALAGFRLLGAF